MARQLDVSALVGPIGAAEVQAQDGWRAPYGDALDTRTTNWLPCQPYNNIRLVLVDASAEGIAKKCIKYLQRLPNGDALDTGVVN